LAITQPFPNINAPIAQVGGVDADGKIIPGNTGRIGQVWLQLLISLWNRTGAAGGGGVAATGMIIAFGSATPPTGWVLCDGTAVSRVDFAALFSVIGTTWGAGDGLTTFNLPNLVDRFAVGFGGSPIGTYGGAASVTLSVGQLPAHSHGVTDPGHGHGVTDPGHHHTAANQDTTGTTGTDNVGATEGTTGNATTGLTVNGNTTGISINNTGSGNPVPTVPPFGAVAWIIKT
jgi:microcystin-dependent protein